MRESVADSVLLQFFARNVSQIKLSGIRNEFRVSHDNTSPRSTLIGGRKWSQLPGGAMIRKILGEDKIGSATRAAVDGEVVHKRAHQKDTASRGAEQVFFGERIGDVLQIETAAFIEDMHDQFAAIQFDSELDFLLAILAISVVVSVDDAFADRHADFVDVVLSEAGFLGGAHHEVFGDIHAFQASIERHIQTPGFWSSWSTGASTC